MSIIERAKAELERIKFGKGDTMAMVDILERFFKQWDSGGAVSVAGPVLARLIEGKPLAPLTGADDEWIDRSEMSGRPMWQNLRCSSVFKDESRAWDIDLPGDDTIIFPYRPGYEPTIPLMTVPAGTEFSEEDMRLPGNITFAPSSAPMRNFHQLAGPCQFCGARVTESCDTLREASGCELPPNTPGLRPRLNTRGLGENDPIPDLATGSLSDEEIFQGTHWTPEQLASMNAMAQDAAVTGLGVVEISHIPRGDFLDTEPEIDMAGQVEVALDRVRAILNQQREQIKLLREQLEAEGAHTAAANALIDEMKRADQAKVSKPSGWQD